MKKVLTLAFSILLINAFSQDRMIAANETVTSIHQVTIKGKSVPYRATTGTQPV